MEDGLNVFSIKDLENFSGIKAHTIRIWEKRYNILEPDRTDSNIRTYNESELKKILNVSFLNRNGLKISKIARLDEDELTHKVMSISSKNDDKLNDFQPGKILASAIRFNEIQFRENLTTLIKNHGLEQAYIIYIHPLLEKARTLFDQTDDILEDKVKQIKKSKAFKDATKKLKKLEGLAEDKVAEFKKSKTKKKLDKALVKAEKKAAKTLKKAKKAIKKAKKIGSDLADQAGDKFTQLTAKKASVKATKTEKPKTARKPKAPIAKPKVAKTAAAKTVEVKPAVVKAVKTATAKTAKPAAPKAKPVAAAKPAKAEKPAAKAVKKAGETKADE